MFQYIISNYSEQAQEVHAEIRAWLKDRLVLLFILHVVSPLTSLL